MGTGGLEPGAQVASRYRVVSLLGSGGSGETYAAELIADGSKVALKRFCLKGAQSWKALELFEREARVLEGIAHPAIPRYKDSFSIDGPLGLELYIVQELATGVSLARWVAEGGRADEQEVRRIAIEVLEILRYLHALTPPVVHRDIKPANLVRGPDGRITLVDFGAVREATTDPAGGSTVAGTYGYMAPEQLRGIALPASDLHGLAASLVFLLTRKSLDQLPQKRLETALPKDLGVSAPLRQWLERMLKPAPEDRFPSAREALASLRDTERRAPGGRRVKVLAAVLGGVVFTAAAGAVALQRLFPVPDRAPTGDTPVAVAPFPMIPELPRSRHLGVRFLKRVPAHLGPVQDIAFSPDGKRLVTGSTDRTAKVFDTATWEATTTLPDHGGPVLGVGFAPDSRTVLTSGGTSLSQWDASSGRKLRSAETGQPTGALAIAPSGEEAFVAGMDGRVRSFRLPGLEPGTTFEASDKGRIITVALTPDGKFMGAGGDDGHLRFFQPAGPKVLRDIPAHAGPVNEIRFSPEGTMFASAGDEGAFQLFHVNSNAPVATFRASKTEAWEVEFSPRSDLLLTGDKNGLVSAWHLPSTNLAWRARPKDARGIVELRTSPDGKWLAIAMANGAVDIYEIPGDDAAQVPDPKLSRKPRPEPTTDAEKARALIDRHTLDPSIRLKEAGDLAAKALEANPKDALAIVQLGRLAYRNGHISGSRYKPAALEEAKRMARRALNEAPGLLEAKELETWVSVSEAQNRPRTAERIDLDQARAAAEAVVAADPTRLEGELLLAVIANAEGADEAAVARASKVVQNADDERLIHLAYGELIEAYIGLGRLDAADAAYKKRIALTPQSPYSRGDYARFLLRRGLRTEAIEMAQQAIKLMNYPNAHHTVADAIVDAGIQQLWDKGDVAGARESFTAALKEDAASADARYGLLACDAVEAAQKREACTTCEVGLGQVLALDPKHDQALWVKMQIEKRARPEGD